MKQLNNKAFIYYAIFIVAFIFLFVAVEINNGRFWTNDFRVYYEATNDFFSGNNPYEHNYGLDTGYFKYPPFTLYLFSLYTLFPYWAEQIVHTIVLTTCLILALPLLKNFVQSHFPSDSKKRNWIVYLVFFCIAIHLVRELHLGNINLLLLGLFTGGLVNMNRKSPTYTVIFWSLMVILKPTMILSFIPLILYRKWKILFLMLGAGIVFFLFPILHVGFEQNTILWSDWFKSVSEHGDYIVSENSLNYLSHFYLGTNSNWIPSLIVLIALISLLFYDKFKHAGKNNLVLWIAVFTAFMPNFFVTDTEHFLLSAPLLIALFYFASIHHSKWMWGLITLAIALFSFHSNDLLGKQLAGIFSFYGLLGIGNLLFITIFLLIIMKPKNIKLNEN